MDRKVIKTRHYKVGYEVRTEEVEHAGMGPVILKSAYTPEGLYLGDPHMARFLIMKKGIKPELAEPQDNICTVGFCERDQKWYGWSHRAINGFGLGSSIKEGDCTNQLPLGTTAHNLEEARTMAADFADGVS